MKFRDVYVVAVLVGFGLVALGLGSWMLAAPGTFFDTLGPFGTRNDHYIRDNATFNLASGALLLVAVRLPGWRVPALAFTTLQWMLHAANHLADIDEADPGWIGVFDFASLLLGVGVLGSAAVVAAGSRRGGSLPAD